MRMAQEGFLGRIYFGPKKALGPDLGFKSGPKRGLGPDLEFKFSPRRVLGPDLGFKFGRSGFRVWRSGCQVRPKKSCWAGSGFQVWLKKSSWAGSGSQV